MDNQRLWQHRSKEEDKEAILSLNLLERANVPKEKTLKCIYAVSNHIEEHYREVFILKNKGGRRKLLVPDYLLHTMQKNILRTILSEEKVSKYAKAYCPGCVHMGECGLPYGKNGGIKAGYQRFF